MKKLLVSVTALLGTAVAAWAQVTVLSDNFDSYPNKAAFDAVWTPSFGVGLSLNTAEFVSSPNSVKNTATSTATAAQSRRFLSTSVPGNAFTFEFKFYDYNAANSVRDYGMVYARSGTDWTGSLLQLLAIGKYNTGTAGAYYYGRVAFGSPVLGPGPGGLLSGNWFQINVANSIGWHTAKIEGVQDPLNPSLIVLNFYIDGTLGRTVSNVAYQDFNWVVLGSGLSSTGGFVSFDDVDVAIVPEPSVAALGLLGGLALLWALRRRAV